MSDLPFLDRYGGQSTDELLALEGKYRTDSIVLAFEEAIMKKPPEAALSYEERVVLAVEALEREVNNGGYSQFFINSSNEHAPIIVDALNAIGASSAAEITKAAIDALGISGATTPQSVEEAMGTKNDTRANALERCDGRYYDEAGDLSTPLLGYIKRNKTKITIR